MADSYQAIYDAVRSRIFGGNIGEVVREVAFRAFDISQSMLAAFQKDKEREWRNELSIL